MITMPMRTADLVMAVCNSFQWATARKEYSLGYGRKLAKHSAALTPRQKIEAGIDMGRWVGEWKCFVVKFSDGACVFCRELIFVSLHFKDSRRSANLQNGWGMIKTGRGRLKNLGKNAVDTLAPRVGVVRRNVEDWMPSATTSEGRVLQLLGVCLCTYVSVGYALGLEHGSQMESRNISSLRRSHEFVDTHSESPGPCIENQVRANNFSRGISDGLELAVKNTEQVTPAIGRMEPSYYASLDRLTI